MASAITKIKSPYWSGGEAVGLILQLPLARPWLLQMSLPDYISTFASYAILVSEFLFLPLLFVSFTKRKIHYLMITLHLGIILCFHFLQIPLLMIALHLSCLPPIRNKQIAS
jgi:hypothetical protein